MKKQVLALVLLCCSLFSLAKDNRPINYQFHKNDTINLLIIQDRDGNKSSAKLQITVQEAKGSKVLLKFNYLDAKADIDSSSGNPTLNFLQNKEGFLANLMSKKAPSIIQYINGEPKSIKNFKEVKASMLEMLDDLFNLATESLPDSLKEEPTTQGMTEFLKPMFEEFMTEDILMAEFSDYIITDLPTELGESTIGDEKAFISSSLLATEKAGEYAYQRTKKANLSKKDLKESNEKTNPAISELTSGLKSWGALATAFLDSLSIDNKQSGIVLSNGIPKHFVVESRIKFSVMGETKEKHEKMTISVIDK